jgi:hypothetical protein
MLDEEICRCYASRAHANGKEIVVDVESSKVLKQQAVCRGFATEKGEFRANLTAWELLVILMREATSAEGFNHEWWAAEITKPDWVKNLDTLVRGGWLHYPREERDLQPKRLGDRIAYQLALAERRLSRQLIDSEYLSRVEQEELRKAQRGMDPEDAEKVRVVFTGYENLKQFAEENRSAIPELRSVVLSLGGGQRIPESTEFLEGVAQGTRRATLVELDDELSADRECDEVTEILSDNWDRIDKMKSRRQITDFVMAQLPDRRRQFLEESRAQDPKTWKGDGEPNHQYKRFVERMRQTIYEPIGLRPRGRGRPENREKES